MRFTVRFQYTRGGARYKVAWEDGVLRGTPGIKNIVRNRMNYWKNKPFDVTAIHTIQGDPMEIPALFLGIMQESFRGVRVEGDIPLLKDPVTGIP